VDEQAAAALAAEAEAAKAAEAEARRKAEEEERARKEFEAELQAQRDAVDLVRELQNAEEVCAVVRCGRTCVYVCGVAGKPCMLCIPKSGSRGLGRVE
jgi:hypothetical protein